MDLSFLNQMVNPVVLGACLIIGYVFKKWIPADNKWIPTVLVIVGAALGFAAMQEISLDAAVGGAFSGLASTGLHQVFKQLVEGKSK